MTDLEKMNIVLSGVVGSTSHGLNLPGADDLDIMGIFVEDGATVCGIGRHKHETRRTAEKGARSGPGDVDEVYYSLRKFGRLAAAGNPSILVFLFLDEYLVKTQIGVELIWDRNLFVSKSAGRRFLGYLQSQRDGLVKSLSLGAARPELVVEHGYDTKYAAHMVRLAYQGIELMRTGRITLPMPESDRIHCMTIRRGGVQYDKVLADAARLEQELMGAIERAELRNRSNRSMVDALLLRLHMGAWRMKS